jgi:Na+:H+ antiporter, NhaA family
MHGPGLQPLGGASPTLRGPASAIDRWMRPLVRFLRIEAASGVFLLLCTVVALALANSPWAQGFADVWQTRLTVAIGAFELSKPLLLWVNDGLMTVFFFVVGLEIKREIVTGELRDPKKAALPVMAALGGMVAPAAIYLLLQNGQPGEPGWGIPMATDIAFVVGFLALLGPRVPIGLKILLLSLAIADDIGAVLVIAIFYSSSISASYLGLAALGFGLTILLNRIGVRSVPMYLVVGALIWFAFLKSGVHPTVAGVLLGLLTPSSVWVSVQDLLNLIEHARRRLIGEQNGEVEHHQKPMFGEIQYAAREAVSPVERLETGLHPWVAFGIMPIFALANAGVSIEWQAICHPVALAVTAGLVLGKPLGILVFSWLAVTVGLARLPSGVNWRMMLGAGCLAGIGFTMSLFIAGLALKEDLLDAGKIGTLLGSAISAIVGSALLLMFLPKRHAIAPVQS